MTRARLVAAATSVLLLAGCAASPDRGGPSPFSGAYGGVSGGLAQGGTH